jgi:hypothetical protein
MFRILIHMIHMFSCFILWIIDSVSLRNWWMIQPSEAHFLQFKVMTLMPRLLIHYVVIFFHFFTMLIAHSYCLVEVSFFLVWIVIIFVTYELSIFKRTYAHGQCWCTISFTNNSSITYENLVFSMQHFFSI